MTEEDDKRLLEMAAQAAGIEHGSDRLECGLSLTDPDGRHRSLPREEFAWLVVQEACETYPADEDDPECIRILRRDLKSAVLAAFLRHDAQHEASN